MNKLKEKKEEVEQEIKTAPKETNKIIRSIGSVFSGSFLTKRLVVDQLPYILFLTAMAILYITNGYYAEQKIRQLNNITSELKELRSEYITSKSELMFISKQSEVARATEKFGLKESIVPPKKIVVKNEIKIASN